MLNVPSFTILITTYNRRQLLARALHSALSQTLPCQVVVVDDCSTDETEVYLGQQLQALDAQGDRRLVYHRNSSNQGHAQSVNTGVEIAQADWIKFLDDDDYLAETCVEVLARAIVHCPQAVICSVQAAQVDLQGIQHSCTQPSGPGEAFYIPQPDVHYGMLLEQVPFGTPVQVAVQRQAFLKSQGWNSHLDTNFDDIESWLNIAQFGDAIFINQCLAYRTLWPGAYNQKFSIQKRLETHILVKEKIYQLVHDRHRQNLPQLPTIKAYLHLYWGLIALKKKQLLVAIEILSPAVFSLRAWQFLRKVIAFRQDPRQYHDITKIALQ
jgi:glycosyltransferase involved in cell wall biosynthesis